MPPEHPIDTEDSCLHKPDWSSVARAEVDSDEGFPVFDVNCRECGLSGSFILDDSIEIQWE